MAPKVSIIIRTKNEERWIKHCLEAVYEQSFRDFETIIVDNKSEDGTLVKAQQFPVKIIHLDKYLPGKSINFGVDHSIGQYIVFLSGHCIPCNKEWLVNLVDSFDDERIAGVYGRQLPMSFTSAHDKRDLFITFGLDPKLQEKDCFFHNANSAIRRDVWEKIPFDNFVTNIEDRLWAAEVQKNGYLIKYTPDAPVYHHHGIHHGGNEKRARSTLKVIEDISKSHGVSTSGSLETSKMNIVGIIPMKHKELQPYQELLLKSTINSAKESQYIKKIVVLTESEKIKEMVEREGAIVPFLRGAEMAKEYVDLSMLYQHHLPKLEEAGISLDLVVSLEPNFLIRPYGILDLMIDEMIDRGYDSIVPAYEEYNATWKSDDDCRVDGGEIPRAKKIPLHVTDKGIALVVYPEVLRRGELYGGNPGRYILKDKFSKIEIQDQSDMNYLKILQEKIVSLDL